jgi:large repetitive protein
MTISGSVYSGLAAGDYTVVAVNNTTRCASNPDYVTISSVIIRPDITVVQTDNSSCDPANPAGQANAHVGGVVEPTYSFEWFDGGNTLPGNLIGNNSAISGLKAGVYTVRVTNNSSGCDSIAQINIIDTPPVITPSPVVTHNTYSARRSTVHLSASAVGGSGVPTASNGIMAQSGAPDINSPGFYSGTTLGQRHCPRQIILLLYRIIFCVLPRPLL